MKVNNQVSNPMVNMKSKICKITCRLTTLQEQIMKI